MKIVWLLTAACLLASNAHAAPMSVSCRIKLPTKYVDWDFTFDEAKSTVNGERAEFAQDAVIYYKADPEVLMRFNFNRLTGTVSVDAPRVPQYGVWQGECLVGTQRRF